MKIGILFLFLLSTPAFAINCAPLNEESILCDNGRPYMAKAKGVIQPKLVCTVEKGGVLCDDGKVYLSPPSDNQMDANGGTTNIPGE